MEPFPAGLAVAGATALVNAMVTDGWEGVRKKIGTLFGRGGEEQAEAALARLDRSHTVLVQRSGDDLTMAWKQQIASWQTRLQDLIDEHPEVEQQLREIVREAAARGIGTSAVIRQSVQAHDQAQVAVQGTGVQHITFGAVAGDLVDGREGGGAA